MPYPGLTPRAWPLRAIRALIVAGTSLALAIGGHTLGGGDAPPVAIAAALAATMTLLVWRLSARKLTTRTIAGALLLAQAIVHLTCGMRGTGAVAPMGFAMIAGHLAATAIALLVLRRGEEALWRLVDLLLIRVHTVRRVSSVFSTPFSGGETSLGWADLLGLHSALLIDTCAVRGPPNRLSATR